MDERLYENTKNTLSALLIDNVSPYLKNHGVIDYTRQKLTDKLTKKFRISLIIMKIINIL